MDIYDIKKKDIIDYIKRSIITLNSSSTEDYINDICIALSNMNDKEVKNELFTLLLKKLTIVRTNQFTMIALISDEIINLNNLENIEYISSCIESVIDEDNKKLLEDQLLNKKTLLECQPLKKKHLDLRKVFGTKQKSNK